jgi:hypothetical protein
VDFIPLRSPPEAEIRAVLAAPSLVDSNVPPFRITLADVNGARLFEGERRFIQAELIKQSIYRLQCT